MAEKQDEGSPPAGMGGFLYRLALAGVGGLMLAQEEIASVLHGHREDEEAAEEAPQEEARAEGEGSAEPEDDRDSPGLIQLDATIHQVLRTFNVPSRAEVDEISRRIDELTARVAALRDRRS
jgi:hypothetical protein